MSTDKYLGFSHHTLAWFRKRVLANEIELRPSFQRQAVWSDRQKSYLIDTMLRQLPVPEMYLQEFNDAEGNEKFVVVDGQQRLTACMDFLDDELVLTSEATNYAGKRFSDLNPKEKEDLFGYKFVVRNLPKLKDETLRDIFTRINKNTVVLNAQEIRHATYWGDFIKTAEYVANHEAWSALGIFTPNDVRRMRHVEFVSEVFVAILQGDQEKKKNLEKSYIAFESDFPRREEIREGMIAIAKWLREDFDGFHKTRWKKKSDAYTLLSALFNGGYGGEVQDGFDENRAAVIGRLRDFGEAVDAFIKTGKYDDETVKEYTMGVERAASDLANRRRRRLAVEAILKTT